VKNVVEDDWTAPIFEMQLQYDVIRLKNRCQANLRNRWLYAFCACAEWYYTSCISQAMAVHWDVKYAENWWSEVEVHVYGQGSGLP